MPDKTKKKSGKRRTEVKDLPKRKKELSNQEQRKVKGGHKKSGDAGVTDGLATPGVINWLV